MGRRREERREEERSREEWGGDERRGELTRGDVRFLLHLISVSVENAYQINNVISLK